MEILSLVDFMFRERHKNEGSVLWNIVHSQGWRPTPIPITIPMLQLDPNIEEGKHWKIFLL